MCRGLELGTSHQSSWFKMAPSTPQLGGPSADLAHARARTHTHTHTHTRDTSIQNGSGGLCADRPFCSGAASWENPAPLPAEQVPVKQLRPQPVELGAREPKLTAGSPFFDKRNVSRTSQVVQWLRLHPPTAGGLVSSPA